MKNTDKVLVYNQQLSLSHHEKFDIFFNDLINIIMPDDYRINEIDIFDYASVISEIKNIRQCVTVIMPECYNVAYAVKISDLLCIT